MSFLVCWVDFEMIVEISRNLLVFCSNDKAAVLPVVSL